MCTSLTQNICLMCHTQDLGLFSNNIGNAGLTALAKAVESGALPALEQLDLTLNQIGDDGLKALAEACASGALDHLTVYWRPTALSPCPETSHAHSSDSDVLFDVPYAGALASQQQDF